MSVLRETICPSCGQSATAGDARCPACGRLLEPVGPVSQAFTTADPAPDPEPFSAASAPDPRADVQPPPPAYAPAPGIPAYAAPPTVPLYGMPAYGPFPYGPYAPPSAPLPYAPPSGWSASPPTMPPAWGMPPAPYGPMPQPRRGRAALIVGLALLVAVIFTSGLGVAAGYYYWHMSHSAVPFGAMPRPTATPNSELSLQDPLTANIYGWSVHPPYCQFANGGYQISDRICFAPVVYIGNGSISVQARQLAGPTDRSLGIVLRYSGNGNGYGFDIASNGSWSFFETVDSTFHYIIDWTPSSAIQRGLSATNTLLVQFGGNHFDLFINGIKVGQADDSTFLGGGAGLQSSTNMQVVFNNITIMTYP